LRIILYTGKGGVGKTSIAAATALRTAELGRPTLVISTDAAHSLADSLDMELSYEPVPVRENLWAQEISILHEMEENWDVIQGYIEDVFAWGGIEEILVEELMAFPGLDELFSLLEIKKQHDRGDFEVIVVDCAPTGETLRMLSFPDVTRWWMERLFPLQRKATAVAKPIMKALTGLPLPDKRIYDSVERFFLQLEAIHNMFSDPRTSTVRLVLNPEKMVIKEAQRTYTYLNLFGYICDSVVANHIIPDEVHDGYFDKWKHLQDQYGREVEKAFYPLPILKLPLFEQEIVGLEMLKRAADQLFGDMDPAEILYKGETQKVAKKGRGYEMSIPLPMVEKEDVELLQKEDEVIVKLGDYKRDIMLPRILAGMQAKGARFEADHLILEFTPARGGEAEEDYEQYQNTRVSSKKNK